MELAEALVERTSAQEKISEISERLQGIAVVQEGEKHAESRQTLLTELKKTCQR